MTIHRNYRVVTFECDGCGEVFEADEENFDEAWQAAKREGGGWVAAKLGQRWEHFCPECKGKDVA